jgi:hypothetical protein
MYENLQQPLVLIRTCFVQCHWIVHTGEDVVIETDSFAKSSSRQNLYADWAVIWAMVRSQWLQWPLRAPIPRVVTHIMFPRHDIILDSTPTGTIPPRHADTSRGIKLFGHNSCPTTY